MASWRKETAACTASARALGLEQRDVYDRYRFDEPWNSPHNRKLAAEMPPYYRCPMSNAPEGMTNYVVVVGPKTAFPGAKKVTYDDITDGSSDTILIVEVADSDVHWMEPRDLRFEDMDFAINGQPGKSISSRHEGEAIVAFCYGHVQPLSWPYPRVSTSRSYDCRRRGIPVVMPRPRRGSHEPGCVKWLNRYITLSYACRSSPPTAEISMARRCEICGKQPQMGNSVTTRGRAKYLGGVGTKITGISRRQFRPNLQRVRVTTSNGTNKRIKVCTQCLRSGAVTRMVRSAPFRLPSEAAKAEAAKSGKKK